MLVELIVENLYRFEIILNTQLGNIYWRGKYLELELIYVREGLVLVLVRSSIVIVIIIGPIVILLVIIIIILVVIILIQRLPARHSKGQTRLPFHWSL